VNSRRLIQIVQADGWQFVTQKGSHMQFSHPIKPGRVTIPHPKKDVKIATVRSVLRQAGLPLNTK
jgi:predicted RNA binding protein YcfA (HicA-like mRNA interferase family)